MTFSCFCDIGSALQSNGFRGNIWSADELKMTSCSFYAGISS